MFLKVAEYLSQAASLSEDIYNNNYNNKRFYRFQKSEGLQKPV